MANINGKYVELAPRKQRREEARKMGVPFEPQYNGESPRRVYHNVEEEAI